MTELRKLSDAVWVSPQIFPEEVLEAKRRGFAAIVNNRPDNEAEDQPSGASIEEAALQAGLLYRAIPITHSGFSEAQVEAMARVLDEAGGPVLAYCRSGTRSTLLWALARARAGEDPEAIVAAAQSAGYDVTPVRAAMDMLATKVR